jgi:hypothetical protein
VGGPVNIRPSVLVVLAAAALLTACSTTTTGEAIAPSGVSAYSTTTKSTPSTTTTRSTSAPSPTAAPSVVPPEAYDEIRASGVSGTEANISDVIDIACIVADGSFNDTKQEIVDAMQQMGSDLSDQQLGVLVTVALTYRCPENSGKLGG